MIIHFGITPPQEWKSSLLQGTRMWFAKDTRAVSQWSELHDPDSVGFVTDTWKTALSDVVWCYENLINYMEQRAFYSRAGDIPGGETSTVWKERWSQSKQRDTEGMLTRTVLMVNSYCHPPAHRSNNDVQKCKSCVFHSFLWLLKYNK